MPAGLPLARWVLVPAALLLVTAPVARAQEVKRLRVLMVLDTSDPDLAVGVAKDGQNFSAFLASHIPANQYKLDRLTGAGVTADRVLAYYRDLKVEPTDGLVFYYSGHGSIRPDRGHTLELQKGQSPLARADLRKALKDKNAALTAILTDCCSDRLTFPDKNPPKVAAGRPGAATEVSPLARRLFFQTRGLIDLTAATNDVALADDQRGGYFTNAICRVADKNRDARMGWRAFHAAVARETTTIHKDAVARGICPQPRQGQRLQEPAQMAPLPPDPQGEPTAGRVAAVVSLVNSTDRPLEFEYRWSPTQAWVKRTLPPNGAAPVGVWVKPDAADLPGLLVRIQGKEQTLVPNRYQGEATPRFADGRVYRFGGRAAPAAGPKSRDFLLDDGPAPAGGPGQEAPADVQEQSFPFPPVGSRADD